MRRRLKTRDGPQEPAFIDAGRRMVNFGSNDYLALAADTRLAAAAADAAAGEGWGSGASPLVTGRGRTHVELENALAEFEGTEAAILFPSGFAANTGSIPALVRYGDAIFADEKNHASLIDGCRLSRATMHVYRHGDMDHLRMLLRAEGQARRRLIVTDSLFSMDGDLAPLTILAELAGEFDCMLMIDEAHATGVFGQCGRGVAEHLGVEDRVDVKMGTLSKALGSAGGFVCGRRSLVEWLVNRARSYMFSTAQPAACAAAAMAALRIVRDEPGRGSQLLRRAASLRGQLTDQGWNIGCAESQIIPLVVGDAELAMRLSAELAGRGFFVPGIRPPSVPPGEALLRVSLTSGHTQEMTDGLLAALGDLARAAP